MSFTRKKHFYKTLIFLGIERSFLFINLCSLKENIIYKLGSCNKKINKYFTVKETMPIFLNF